MRGLMLFFTVVYIVTQAFDAVLRWVLNLANLAPLIYLRDYSLVFVIIFGFYVLITENRDVSRTVWVLLALALGSCVGLFSGLSIVQVLFGIKIWLPFVTGFMLLETGTLARLHRPHAWALLWLVSCLGVIINYFHTYPWAALLIDVGDVRVMGERGASTFGVARLSGFTRANYDAATLVLLLYIYLMVFLRGWWWRGLIVVLSGLAIALTTTKGALGAFLACLLLLPVLNSVRTPHGAVRGTLVALLILVALIGMVFPLVSSQLVFPRLNEQSLESYAFASFVDRATHTWPHALSLLGSGWQWLTGRGVGGIGAAQTVFEAGRFNPADNLFIYMYVTAGVFGAVMYLFYAFASYKLLLYRSMHRAMFMALFAFFIYGITVNIVENAAAALVLGALTCVLSAPGLEPQPQVARALVLT